jgi:hypothetical protein
MRALILLAALVSSACATWSNQGFLQGLSEGLAAQRGVAPALIAPTTNQLLLFGGQNHDVFLGCLSCTAVDPASVFNEVGPYGSAIAPHSIRNKIGEFGNSFGPVSACSVLATHPPVIVDRDGTYYGELTVADYRPQALALLSLQLHTWLKRVCDQP